MLFVLKCCPMGKMGRNMSKYYQFGTPLKPIVEECMRKKGKHRNQSIIYCFTSK